MAGSALHAGVFEAASRALSARLSATAFAHCTRTAATAADLARTYGADVELARLAGLLHDWDREVPKRDLVERAQSHGIDVSDVEHAQPKLLHARTGSAAVREEFPGLPEAVYSAVEKHTLGALEMSDIDRIVYLADMLEPARDYPGVDELRAEVGRVSLGELYLDGYASSVKSLIDRRKRLHPDTVEVWNALIAAAKAGERS